ncbi:GTP-binding protein at3g49725 chloroplastic [Phtheirospermum japonicum]|uniref:GTP-binding protein at3g49725 chloroplastic n=1 Tax=Phtheirospermum japonicum TaxID=374723 RepID=A0A830CGW7_9LAMI|nr:GTP-binding protein at3g49725 chloroplastic [Phtheirospermum japonicum]
MIRTIFPLRSSQSLLNPINPPSSSSTFTIIPPQFPPLSSYFSKSPILERKQLNRNDDEFNKDADAPPRLFVVQPRIRPEIRLRSKLEEALNLANSLEQQRDGFYETEFLDKEMPPHLVVQNPLARSTRADMYFGVGTVSTIKCHINILESKDEVDAIFVNAILSGVQQRNLERIWSKPVLDRIGLIIEIFNAHAQTKEAKLQAELAALMYKRSRLVRVRGLDGRYTFGEAGEAEVVSARGRGSGGRGFISGAGETELQLQRRRISDRRKKLLSEIKEVRRTRAMQRIARRRQGVAPGQEIVTVAVVGYTNAGKSTLVSELSNNYLYCDDRLFATVDPKLSSVILPSGRKVLLSDTVGFISDLPVQLVEAFHATLEEVVEADLLVHVLDSSAPNLDEHRETVMQVLGRIGVSEEKLQNMIEVWNKVDILEDKSDIGEFEDGDYACSFSDEEDADVTSNQLTDQLANEQDIEEAELASDDLGEQDEDAWVDDDGRSIGCATVDNDQQNELSGAAAVKNGSEFTGHIKTSAVTGVGLQELLELIDDKLGPCRVVERSVFDRKWRPPRNEDNEIAAEQ